MLSVRCPASERRRYRFDGEPIVAKDVERVIKGKHPFNAEEGAVLLVEITRKRTPDRE